MALRDKVPWPPSECVALLGDNGGRSWEPYVRAAAFRPDGKVIATADQIAGKCYIHLWDAETLRERAALTPAGTSQDSGDELAYSPDGRLLAARSFDGLRLWDAGDDGLTHERMIEAPDPGPDRKRINMRFSHPLFTADGRALVAWDICGAARNWRLTSGDPVEEGESAPAPKGSRAVAVSADGRTEAYILSDEGTGKDRLCVRTLFEDRPEEKPVELTAPAEWLALAPDGKRLAARVGTAGLSELRLWGLDDGKPRLTKTIDLSKYGINGNEWIPSPRFTPDGKQVAFINSSAGKAAVWLFDAAAGAGTRLDCLGYMPLGPSFTADGRCLLVRGNDDGRLRLWEDQGKGFVFRPSGPAAEGQVRRLAFRPGGDDLAVVSRRGDFYDGRSNLVVWDWTTGRSRARVHDRRRVQRRRLCPRRVPAVRLRGGAGQGHGLAGDS